MSRTTLGCSGRSFTVNGSATFLLGISYYGALYASRDHIGADLDDMQRCGFNWLRVWANWRSDGAALTRDGTARTDGLALLRWLVDECDRRGLIVDVTQRPHMVGGQPDIAALRRGVATLAEALAGKRNWYLDPCNEHDVHYVSATVMGELTAAARERAPGVPVGASYWFYDTGREGVKHHLEHTRPDVLAPHLNRYRGCAGETAAKVRTIRRLQTEFGAELPIHLQEPFRRGFRAEDWEPRVHDFLTDLEGALAGGAAGWCFHNGDRRDVPDRRPRRSFDLSEERLFAQFDDTDRRILAGIGEVMAG